MAPEFQLEALDPAAKKKRLKAKPGKRAKQRSMELLRKEGYVVGNAEYWSAFAGKAIDLFGFIDLVALDVENKKIIAVQVTKGHVSEHITKIRSIKAASAWLECGGEIVIHHWWEVGPGKPWSMEVISITADSDTHEVEPDFFEVKQ
jgi:hypothetical protein